MATEPEVRSRKAPVSVVIPCYSCAATIERTVESVMTQTMLPEEVWLIDDGSPDGGETLRKLEELREQFSEKTIVNVIPLDGNHGPSFARNRGWDSSTQEYIAFLDADDAWHPRKLEIQYSWMSDHPDVVLTGHQWPWVAEDQPFQPIPKNWRAWKVSPLKELLSNRFSTSTVMLCREAPYRLDENEQFTHDFDLWMRIVLDGHPAWRLEIPLTHIYKAQYGSGGLSANLWPMGRAELRMYWRRVQDRRLNIGAFALLLPWIAAKFTRRLARVGLRRTFLK